MTRNIKCVVVLAGLLLTPIAVTPAVAQDPSAQAAAEMQQRVTGREVFRAYCATCHGTAGRGDGPLSAKLRVRPADLAEISKRNGGQFPSDQVFRTIDGRQRVRGHGGPDMPEWGETFLKSREGGDAANVKLTIDSLVRFIESLQLQPVH